MSHLPFSGVITALITPFNNEGNLDLPAFNDFLKYQKKSGVHGVVILGTTGENVALSEEESEQLVLSALDHQTDHFHIYVGTGTNSTQTTIIKSMKYAQMKSSTGQLAKGVMVVTPYYNRPSQNGLIKHYEEVAKSISDTPICIYNVPSRTGVNLLPQTLVQISLENKNIVAIKEAAGNVNAVAEMRIALNHVGKQNFKILSGDDATYVPALMCGAEGVISVTSNVIPKAMLDILDNFKKGDLSSVQKLHLAAFCINNGLFSVPNPIGVKWILSHLRICGTNLRAPLYPASDKEAEMLKGILFQLEKNNIKILT
ncbi:4-hydroxy-tetrahydrodipicolinate synthase [Fluviispira multicolorata]|uniref:4-hydroxy-tetrahydrodipicolinate synthase n=1 Tax=Fluviispira multicolorata TaxID=2654512 RepID=UPI0013758CB2|nr:4-hydroxy-tetrahydrodipicolinate synthase [Fluviispira multicolorata]